MRLRPLFTLRQRLITSQIIWSLEEWSRFMFPLQSPWTTDKLAERQHCCTLQSKRLSNVNTCVDILIIITWNATRLGKGLLGGRWSASDQRKPRSFYGAASDQRKYSESLITNELWYNNAWLCREHWTCWWPDTIRCQNICRRSDVNQSVPGYHAVRKTSRLRKIWW